MADKRARTDIGLMAILFHRDDQESPNYGVDPEEWPFSVTLTNSADEAILLGDTRNASDAIADMQQAATAEGIHPGGITLVLARDSEPNMDTAIILGSLFAPDLQRLEELVGPLG